MADFDPDAYLAGKSGNAGGFNPDAYLAAKGQQAPNSVMDSLKGFGSGVLKNLDMFITDNPLNQTEADPQYHPLPSEEVKPFPGSDYKPQSGIGSFAQTAGEFAPAAIGGEGSVAGRLLGRVLAPAAGAVAGGAAFDPIAHPALHAAGSLAGAMLGGSPAAVSSGASALAKGLANRLAEGLPAEDAALVSKYEAMGGHLRPGQYSPSNFMRQGDAVIADTPWPRAAGFSKDSPTMIHPSQQADEYTRFLTKTFGEDAPRMTDEVIGQAYKRIGKVHEEVLPRNSVAASQPLTEALGKVEENLKTAAPAMDSADAARVQNVLEGIRTQLANGGIPGKLYQQYRQRGGLLDEMAGSSSPTVNSAGTAIRRALDDAFVEQANELDAPALTQARAQYRNLETLAPLAAKAPTGKISPGLVLGAVNKEFGSPGAAGDLGTLAQVGSAFLKAQPSSGTAERSVWRSLINKPFSEGIPAIANSAVSLPISAVATRQLNKVINSPEMRARLLGEMLQNPGATNLPATAPNGAALARALTQ